VSTAIKTTHVADVISQYGECLELIPMDAHFFDISVGLYVKDGVATVWTFSGKPGVEKRIQTIRDQLVALGGLVPVPGTSSQVRFACGDFHRRPSKFLLMQAVDKDPSYAPPEGEMAIKDTRTRLTLHVDGRAADDRWIYTVSAEGQAPNVPARLAAIVGGFARYGEMEKVSDTEIAFSCGGRHDQLVRLLLPYARNMSAVEEMMQAAALRGQLTTGTAGFTPL
jgi:hypothetical protein